MIPEDVLKSEEFQRGIAYCLDKREATQEAERCLRLARECGEGDYAVSLAEGDFRWSLATQTGAEIAMQVAFCVDDDDFAMAEREFMERRSA